jgi:ADP-heptose:LPS heptosyltransferase
VPGGAEHRPRKRWPVSHYAELAKRLAAKGVTPVIAGGPGESSLAAEIAAAAPGALNLAGKTTLADLVRLARRAAFAVGNDTGPMHLIAVAGTPALVLYSHESDPKRCAQRGAKVDILRVADLAALQVDEVMARLP